MIIDIGRSVTYPFEDKQWQRKLITLLILGFVPGLNIILWSGYAITVARNMARNEPELLPDWESWSDIAVRGLLALAATALYFSPALLIGCCMLLASWAFGSRADGVFLALRCAGIGLALFYVLTVNYVLWSGHLSYARTDQFFRYLEIGRRLRDVRVMPGLFAMLFVYQGALSLMLLLLTAVGGILFLFALSAIVTLGGLIGALLLLLTGLAVIGYVSVVSLAVLANGYILGAAIRSIPHG